jgi:hypothetical protein
MVGDRLRKGGSAGSFLVDGNCGYMGDSNERQKQNQKYCALCKIGKYPFDEVHFLNGDLNCGD